MKVKHVESKSTPKIIITSTFYCDYVSLYLAEYKYTITIDIIKILFFSISLSEFITFLFSFQLILPFASISNVSYFLKLSVYPLSVKENSHGSSWYIAESNKGSLSILKIVHCILNICHFCEMFNS